MKRMTGNGIATGLAYYERLRDIENILGNEYDLDLVQKLIQTYREGRYIIMKEPEQAGVSRLRELAQADRAGLVHIIQGPDPGAAVCGNCGNFIRNPGKRTGVCTEQSCYRDHHGNEEPWRGTFSPSQSRKACRKFVRRGKDKP